MVPVMVVIVVAVAVNLLVTIIIYVLMCLPSWRCLHLKGTTGGVKKEQSRTPKTGR